MPSELVARELTPPGRGAISVLELVGEDALDTARRWCGCDRLAAGDVRRARLQLQGEALDEVVLVARSSQAVEFQLHGSPLLVRRVCRAWRELGVRILSSADEPGGLGLEERALAAVAEAASEAGARLLLDQANGALRGACERICRQDPERARLEIERLLEASRCARFALHPARVVIVGPVNAGKSTLFNTLVGRERALVSALPGTTRDAVVERGFLGPWPVEWVDTAGERAERAWVAGDRGQALERAGLERAQELSAGAAWVLRLVPAGATDGDAAASADWPCEAASARPPCTLVRSRDDDAACGVAGISARARPAQAVERIAAWFRGALGLPERAWTAGAAAAFDEDSRAALRAAAEEGPRALRRWLDGWPPRALPEAGVPGAGD